MKLVVPRESLPGETRVALTPDVVDRLVKAGFEVRLEAGAGQAAYCTDSAYEEVGAEISASAALYDQADLVLRVNPPNPDEIAALPENSACISLLFPLSEHDSVERLQARSITAFALDRVPRITRAQSMDVLSSQSTVAGYMAVLLAATKTPKFFPMLTTAAGTIPPAKVIILGVGVAGLQAIATARRLGAVVKAYDIRAACKEQVESLGATFLELPDLGDMETEGGYARALTPEEVAKQQAALAEFLAEADVIVTTALVPGRPAPRLITAEMAKRLTTGTVVLDMAAETGGNCELTVPGEDTLVDGVLYLGPQNMPATLPQHASRMFAKNLQNLLKHLAPEGELALDFEDEITTGCMITHAGEVRDPHTRKAMGLEGEAPPPPTAESEVEPEAEAEPDAESAPVKTEEAPAEAEAAAEGVPAPATDPEPAAEETTTEEAPPPGEEASAESEAAVEAADDGQAADEGATADEAVDDTDTKQAKGTA